MPKKQAPTLATAIPEITRLWKDAIRKGNLQDDWDLAGLFRDAASSYNEGTPSRLRLSHGKACARCHWYEHHHPELEKPRGTERVSHLMGHIWEAIALGALDYALAEHPTFSFERDWMQKELILPEYPSIKGHCDGAIYWNGEPWAIVDPKYTKFFAHHWWFPRLEKGEEPSHLKGRIPPETWGYRHQAGNYLAASGLPFKGFIWAVGFKDSEKLSLGWADAEELLPYNKRAIADYTAAMGNKIPPPVHPLRDAAPCMDKRSKKVYCNFYTTCLEV